MVPEESHLLWFSSPYIYLWDLYSLVLQQVPTRLFHACMCVYACMHLCRSFWVWSEEQDEVWHVGGWLVWREWKWCWWQEDRDVYVTRLSKCLQDSVMHVCVYAFVQVILGVMRRARWNIMCRWMIGLERVKVMLMTRGARCLCHETQRGEIHNQASGGKHSVCGQKRCWNSVVVSWYFDWYEQVQDHKTWCGLHLNRR